MATRSRTTFAQDLALVASLAALCLPAVAFAAVRVVIGPTPIVDGDAKAPGDITVVNEHLAFALAVKSRVPYGVPRGAIVDVAPVENGKVGRDRTVFADFIPNNWSAWPNTYHRIDILERSPERVVIQTTRDWGKVTIATTYTLRAKADHVEIHTAMTNESDAALPDLLSGLTLWPRGGFFFPVPGLAGVTESKAEGALSDRVVAYDADWTVTLHAPYLDHVGSGSRDLFRQHTLAPHETHTFDGWLQVGSRGDLAPVVRAEIERKRLQSGSVRGTVTGTDGKPVDQPVIVVETRGKPYAWTLGRQGHYDLTLPVGEYVLYATASNRSQSAPTSVHITPDSRASLDFHDIENPGLVRFRVTDTHGSPLDARIAISQGQRPLVEFLGRKTFFTALEPVGQANLALAPGPYVFSITSGGGFFSRREEVKLTLEPGATQTVDTVLTRRFDPRAKGWFAADLHHHADQAEAVTPPVDLARSQLAAGLDLMFVSDHDSTVNHAALQEIARRRGIPFIPSLEISPSWGHFNAYPLTLGQKLAIDTSTATIGEVLHEARRQGAIVVQANHPFIPYGYFASLQAGVAPGGFNPAFNLLEINATVPGDDVKVLHKLWDFWNAGQHYYLSAGTDTHDVWNEESGRVRAFAHVEGTLTARSFAEALRDGHGYVSYGPLIYPSVMFGTAVRLEPGQPLELHFKLESMAGLRRAELVGSGSVVATREFADFPSQGDLDYLARADQARWYALTVEDQEGRRAYTDPIWVDTVP